MKTICESSRLFLICTVCCSVLFRDALASQEQQVLILKSPNKQYALHLSSDPSASRRKLTVTHSGRELARYNFQGDLVNAYWSPSGHYDAINNHYGNRGWYVWIVALSDGSIIHADGTIRAADYDRYLDYTYLPDISVLARSEVVKVYDGYATDYNYKGYTTLTYGWVTDHKLQLFHEFTVANLWEREHSLLQVYSVCQIKDSRFAVRVVSAKRVNGGREMSDIPSEVKKVLEME